MARSHIKLRWGDVVISNKTSLHREEQNGEVSAVMIGGTCFAWWPNEQLKRLTFAGRTYMAVATTTQNPRVRIQLPPFSCFRLNRGQVEWFRWTAPLPALPNGPGRHVSKRI